MKRFSEVLVSMLVMMFLGGCSGGGLDIPFDPLKSEAEHQVTINAGSMVMVPAVDGDMLVNVVFEGQPSYAKVSEVVEVRWYSKPNWQPVKAAFSQASVMFNGTGSSGEGIWTFITRDSKELWINLDHVQISGLSHQRTNDDLIKYGDGVGSLPDPSQSKVNHQVTINAGSMVMVPAVDGGKLVNVVYQGQPAYAAISDVVEVRWYSKPNWKPVKAGFNQSSVTLSGTGSHGEGTWTFITRDGKELWINLDHVQISGLSHQRTNEDLIKY